MRHFEEYEIEHLLNSTGNPFLRLLCRWHLKKCTVCRKRLKELQEDQLFIRQLRKGVQRLEAETRREPPPEEDPSAGGSAE